jgi:two-component system sensor histidine kinase UhpB
LSGLTVNLEAIKIMLGPEQEEICARVNRALENTRTGLIETRRALKDLRIKQLEELGLGNAIRSLANDAALRAGFRLKVNIDGDLAKIPADAEQGIYRIAQETLENTVKHAEAENVTLCLHKNQEHLELEISDDGRGFDTTSVDFENKMGLKGLRERASAINGDLEISSQPGEGTRVHLVLENLYD